MSVTWPSPQLCSLLRVVRHIVTWHSWAVLWHSFDPHTRYQFLGNLRFKWCHLTISSSLLPNRVCETHSHVTHEQSHDSHLTLTLDTNSWVTWGYSDHHYHPLSSAPHWGWWDTVMWHSWSVMWQSLPPTSDTNSRVIWGYSDCYLAITSALLLTGSGETQSCDSWAVTWPSHQKPILGSGEGQVTVTSLSP